jgi:hypothetical protein
MSQPLRDLLSEIRRRKYRHVKVLRGLRFDSRHEGIETERSRDTKPCT